MNNRQENKDTWEAYGLNTLPQRCTTGNQEGKPQEIKETHCIFKIKQEVKLRNHKHLNASVNPIRLCLKALTVRLYYIIIIIIAQLCAVNIKVCIDCADWQLPYICTSLITCHPKVSGLSGEFRMRW